MTRTDACRMCPDEWMIAAGIDLWDTAARALIEWGTWTRQERDTLREAARAIPAAVELRPLVVDLDELWRWISERSLEAQFGRRAITRHELATWADWFETPTADERALYDAPHPIDGEGD